jgi:uncharacterized protein with von Willebrand factor type A (vWA) domain
MKTEIIAITDSSGSMDTIKSAVIGGFNSFVQEQRQVAGEARMTHVTFNEEHKLLYQAIALAQVPLLDADSYQTSGCTALFDTLGDTLETQGKRIAEEGWADQVIVEIITDGLENASRRYKREQIRSMIEHAQRHGWHFVFLAANQDAFAAAASYGISAATTANFTASAAGATQAYGTIGAMTRALRSAPGDEQALAAAVLGGL